MTKLWAIIFALLAGGSTALEAFINGELGKSTTALVATFISLTVGAIFLASIIVTGDLKCLVSINGFNYKLLLGGVFGGLIIYFTVKAIPNLGVSNTLILTLVSQVLVGFLLIA